LKKVPNRFVLGHLLRKWQGGMAMAATVTADTS